MLNRLQSLCVWPVLRSRRQSTNGGMAVTDNATDFGQEAYGQFYLPLTNNLSERGIDAINPQQHGFSGR